MERQEFTEGVIPQAFILCPNNITVKVEDLFEQGIFASEIEMSSMMETRNSMPVFFTTTDHKEYIIHENPEIAEEFFNKKWDEPITGYKIIKNLCKIKCTPSISKYSELFWAIVTLNQTWPSNGKSQF